MGFRVDAFGQGERPYSETGPLAVLARAALLACAIALVVATLTPDSAMPALLYSYNLEHFAAFYVAALIAAAAFPKLRLRWLIVALGLFAAGLECLRLLNEPGVAVVEKWNADFGGVLAAYAPIALERFRRMFETKGEA